MVLYGGLGGGQGRVVWWGNHKGWCRELCSGSVRSMSNRVTSNLPGSSTVYLQYHYRSAMPLNLPMLPQ